VIVVDTGPLVAAALAGDTNHRRCVELFTSLHLYNERPVVPAFVVKEVCDLPLGLVDDSVVALAEELGVQEIATLDRRRFTVVRPSHIDAFTVLP
jgi:predicted nucleic acid-binding protein